MVPRRHKSLSYSALRASNTEAGFSADCAEVGASLGHVCQADLVGWARFTLLESRGSLDGCALVEIRDGCGGVFLRGDSACCARASSSYGRCGGGGASGAEFAAWINLSNWFQAGGDPAGLTQQHFDTAITDDDLALIKAMGFDHVRIAINPAPLFRRGQADQLPADYLGYLDTAVNKVLAHGLAVELDIHASGDFKHSLAVDDRFVQDFADFGPGWRDTTRRPIRTKCFSRF